MYAVGCDVHPLEYGMGWKMWGEDKDVMVIGCEDGDVEFVVVRV